MSVLETRTPVPFCAMIWGMTWYEELERDGYAIVPTLLSGNEVEELRSGFDELLAIARRLDGTTEFRTSRFVVDSAPFRLHRVVWCGGAAPSLAAFGTHPRVLEVAARALESAALVQIIQQAHYKLPGDEVSFNWHQDASNRRYGTELWKDVNRRGSFIEVAVALDSMDPHNGPLEMIPGSHHRGFLADPSTGALPEEAFDRTQAVSVCLSPGDAVVFGPFVIHGSGPNRSGASRRLFLQGFALPGANRREYPGCGTGEHRYYADFGKALVGKG